MQNYNPEAKCEKCGHDVVNTIHAKEIKYDLNDKIIHDIEYLSRCCQRCFYKWKENTIDRISKNEHNEPS